jgi:hypothetical protein
LSVAAKNRAKHEARTRVVFNLPLNDAGEETAFYEDGGIRLCPKWVAA